MRAARDGVREKVVEHLSQFAFVRDNRAEFGRSHAVEFDRLLLREPADGGARFAQRLAHREVVQEQLRVAGFEAREIDELADARVQLLP